MAGVVGIGLVALDVVIDERTQERLGAWAGGSCGNVLAILSWLGWDAAPAARLDGAADGQAVRDDLERFGVDTRWLSLGDVAPTPIYIERLREASDGTVRHRFDRYCPSCRGRLPGYQPVSRGALRPVLDELDEWDVVYLDRPSAGAVTLAQRGRDLDKLVFFEPSAKGDPRHLSAIASCADIVKYSDSRLTLDDRKRIAQAAPSLEIETRGSAGLRFRTTGEWHTLSPLSVTERDTAGAGDWTTAGIIHKLRDCLSIDHMSLHETSAALAFGQALGAWSCQFRAPRGAMHKHTPAQAITEAQALMHGTVGGDRQPLEVAAPSVADWACSSCA